jgi:exodeoxyribonuclease VII large subunit
MPSGARQLFDPEAPPTGGAAVPTEDGEQANALSIGALYDEVGEALASVFPRRRQLWVRGEIHSLSDQSSRSGHCYLELVDPDNESGRGRGAPPSRGRGVPVLMVKCWKGTWGPLKGALGRQGITLTEGMVVVLRGSLDVYRPKGEIDFILSELDVTALLGRLAAQRAELLRKLESEGLLGRNREIAVPDVPLRVGLVASPGTEGYRDFLGQLTGSAFGFQVQVVPVSVQGGGAPNAVARAVSRPKSWRGPLRSPPNQSGPASGTRGMSPWPTLWRIERASLQPSVVTNWSFGSGNGGSPTSPSRRPS